MKPAQAQSAPKRDKDNMKAVLKAAVQPRKETAPVKKQVILDWAAI